MKQEPELKLEEIYKSIAEDFFDEFSAYPKQHEQFKELIANMTWKPIASAPAEQWLEVCGDSQMTSPPHFIAVAMKMMEYRPLDPWRDVTQSALSDNGWKPVFWRKLQPIPNLVIANLPKAKP